ncbi:hypothetical protein D3C87_1955170 [compost metagenome]
MLVLPALVGVDHGALIRGELVDGFVQHLTYQIEHGLTLDLISHDFAVVEVHDRRQVELHPLHLELGDVGHPLLVGPLGMELAIEVIANHNIGCPFERSVALHADP